MDFLYIYLFYNFLVHSTCFERSSRSLSGVDRSALYYAALYNCANVSSCFGLTDSHDYTELCNTVHYDQLLIMNDSIVRNM